MVRQTRFDRGRLDLRPLGERVHDLDLGVMKPLARPESFAHPSIDGAAARIREARQHGAEVVMMMGGHVIRSGTQRFIIDLLDRGMITALAMNGSCVIHDYEFALIGKTTESVARYVSEGYFGLWKETGGINDAINSSYNERDEGYGEAMGRTIAEGEFPHKDLSVLAACHRLGVPCTVHIGIGYDIIHEHPNFDAAAAGVLSYRDFLAFAELLGNLDGGVVMNFGSAVMAPEVFLKALAMARNAAHKEGRHIRRFTTVVCDIKDLPASVSAEPPKNAEGYYFRPWKTMLVRTVAEGGESFYIKGTHAETVPALWQALVPKEDDT